MRSSCRTWLRVKLARQIGCLLALSAGLIGMPASADDSSAPTYQENILISQNPDGATLPPPTRKLPAPPAAASSTTADASAKKNADGAKPNRPEGLHQGMGHRGGPFGEMDFSLLNPTDDQKEKIEQIRSENRPKTRDVRRRLQEVGKQLSDLMFDGTSTDAQIRKKSEEMRQIHAEMEDLQMSDFLAIRAILTPEQKGKLKDVHTAMEEKRRDFNEQMARALRRQEGNNKSEGKAEGKRDAADGSGPVKNKKADAAASKTDSLSNR